MTSRALLAGGGVLLLGSLFLPWFDGVSGWEHWVWADVPLAGLAVVLVAAAARPEIVPLRIVAVILCGLGIAVVFGHGMEPRVEVRDLSNLGAGGFVALVGLTAGAVGAAARWPRLLLVAGSAGIVASLFSAWGDDGGYLLVFGAVDRLAATDYPNGFERWRLLDIALVALAAFLLLAAARPLPRIALALMGAASIASAACILIANVERTQWMAGDGGVVEGAPLGALGALLALAAAVAGLALRASTLSAYR